LSTGENIKNAMQVLFKTYESVNKMLEHTKALADESGYVCKSDRFLRYKSDVDVNGWMINSFILVFQNQQDPLCDSQNGWRNGSVYSMEILLGDKQAPHREPEVVLARHDYASLEDWYEGCAPSDHWGFHQPTDPSQSRHFSRKTDNDLMVTVPNSMKASETYWGLKQVVSTTVPLTEITSSTLKAKVFDIFDRLAEYA